MDYEKIKFRCKELRIRQEDMCAVAGITTSGLQKIFREKNTTIVTLEKISAALKVPVTYWFSDEATLPTDTNMDLQREVEMLRSQLRDKERIIGLMEKEILRGGATSRQRHAV